MPWGIGNPVSRIVGSGGVSPDASLNQSMKGWILLNLSRNLEIEACYPVLGVDNIHDKLSSGWHQFVVSCLLGINR